MNYHQKEIFSRLFRGYIKIIGNPQSEYRNEAAVEISKALNELEASETSFDILATDKRYQELIMVTDTGMKKFIDFIHEFIEHGYDDNQNMSDIVAEQIHISNWVKEHRKELIV